jgi:hypothetical protein
VCEDVLGGGGERVRAADGVDRASHSFYSRFINYRTDIIRVDAGVEAALGIALLAGFGARDFPHPVGRVLVVTVGALLLALAVVLWRGRVGVRALAAGNLLTAMLAVLWLALASGFSVAGGALVAAAVAALAILAALQLSAARL